jgi:hypothetical protein
MAASSPLSVFINCPFDRRYKPFFDAIIFTVARCGFQARCALEISDSGGTRIDKIMKLIEDCRYGIHDLSRTQLDPKHRLPRFNMPLELGIFLGAKRFGGSSHRLKRCLVLDKENYRYQKFISDIAGQDIDSHSGSPESAIVKVRDFLRAQSHAKAIPSGAIIAKEYRAFEQEKPRICRELKLVQNDLTFADQAHIVAFWIKQNAGSTRSPNR